MFILFSQDMWNNLLWPLIVMRSDNHFPLAVGIASMVNVYKPEYDLLIAASVLATLPVLILFLFFQHQFVTGLTATGLMVEKQFATHGQNTTLAKGLTLHKGEPW